MDRLFNPFQPGAGTEPPELTGRDSILENADMSMKRLLRGRAEQGMLLTGLRGVGKTVLLERIRIIAENNGLLADLLEAPEGGHLGAILVPSLRASLLKLSSKDRFKDLANKALRVLTSFSLTMGAQGVDFGLKYDPAPGTADSGFLERDLAELFVVVGEAAKANETGVAILLDEIQYLSKGDLSALIVATHRVAQRKSPIAIYGAGLPLLPALTGAAKTYSERLFRYPNIGPLAKEDAEKALVAPAKQLGVTFERSALNEIVKLTEGYPYFLQEWGYAVWNVAPTSPITLADVRAATASAIAKLDESFFRMRLEHVNGGEEKYMRAMAELKRGPHQSAAVAKVLGKKSQQVAVAREALIRKALIYSPKRGSVDFTVPMFDAFMRRAIPKFQAAGADRPRGGKGSKSV